MVVRYKLRLTSDIWTFEGKLSFRSLLSFGYLDLSVVLDL